MGKRIDELGAAVALTGVEEVALVQAGQTLKGTINQIQTYVNPCSISCASVFIESADVSTIFDTPIELIPAQGAGKFTEVLSVSYWCGYDGVTPYATHTTLTVESEGADVGQYQGNINVTVNAFRLMQRLTTGTVTFEQILENTAVNVTTLVGNPTGGSTAGDIYVFCTYRVHDLSDVSS